MAVFDHLGLVSLAVLMLASQLDFASAAVRVYSLRASNLPGDALGNKPDPYVKVWCGSTYGGQTEYYQGTTSPTWVAEFNFPNCRAGENLKLEVWDKDVYSDDRLGTCTTRLQQGTYSVSCSLSKGTMYYSYRLS